MKTIISPENLQTLEDKFKAGLLISKGKQCLQAQLEAQAETGLPLQVIKDWIGNRKKKESGRKYVHHKPVYSRGITAFNYFVSTKKDEFQGIGDWAPAWNNLSQEEKLEFKERAKEKSKVPSQDKGKAAKALLKKIINQIIEIGQYGVDLAIIGIDKNDGQAICYGELKTGVFLNSRPHILQELYSFHSFDAKETQSNFPVKELRKKAQAHMNELYSKAIGKCLPFPYKKVAEGALTVSGLPEQIYPIRTMSHYGEKNLQDIISVQEIWIESTVQEQIVSYEDDGDYDDVARSNAGLDSDEVTNEDLLYDLLVTPTPELDTHALVQIEKSDVDYHNQTSPAVTHTQIAPSVTPTNTTLTITHTHTKPSVTHTHTIPSVTHTHTKPSVTHTHTKPSVTHTHTKLSVTHTHTKPSDTYTHTKPSVTHTHTKSSVTHTHTKPSVTQIHTKPSVTHTHTKPSVTHTHTKPSVTHTKPSVTHTHTKPSVTHTDTKPSVTQIHTKPSVTHTHTKPSVTHTHTKPSVTHTHTKPSVTHTHTKPSITHTHTKPSVTHTHTKPSVTHTHTKPSVTHTHTKPSVTHTHTKPSVTHTHTKPSATHTHTKPSVTHTHTKPSATHTHTKPSVTHTQNSHEKQNCKRKRNGEKKRVIKKKKTEQEYRVKDIISSKSTEGGRYYLVHWDGYDASDSTWEPETNISSVLIGQYYAKNQKSS